MKKYEYTNNMNYTYDATRRGAKYLIGDAYKNHGEWLESIAKFHRGLDYLVNPNTSYDTGSDIESMNASVKSSGASLASIYGDFETIKKIYFENVHSTLWIFMMDIDETIIEYHMNKKEFEDFINTWGTLAKESGSELTKIRIKKTSAKMIKWFEERL